MRAIIPTRHVSPPASAAALQPSGNARHLLEPLVDLAGKSDFLLAGVVGEFHAGRALLRIPRFIFLGPTGGGNTIRLGLLAAFHGDEPEGVEVLVEFLRELEREPDIARGFHLHVYPICNPGGFAANTRLNFSGVDLAEQFWRGSSQPEVYYLERELGIHHFQGVISLHTEENATHFLARANSSILNLAVAQPALQAANKILPGSPRIDSTDSTPSSIRHGFLTDTDELAPVPFEINLGIPRLAPKPSQIQGSLHALKSILDSYRATIAHRQNI